MTTDGGFPTHDTGAIAAFQQRLVDTADEVLADPRAPVVEADPSLLSLLAAHWQAGTSIGALTANSSWRTGSSTETVDLTPEDIQLRLEEDGIEPQYRHAFYNVRDSEAYESILEDVVAGRERHRVMQQFGLGANLAAGFVAGIADPVNLIPLGGAVSKIRMAADGAMRTVGRTAVQAGVATAAVEAGIQFADPTKTAGESLVDIGVGTAFGALLGYGVHAVVAAPKARAIEARMQKYLVDAKDEDIVRELRTNTARSTEHTPATPEARNWADEQIARTSARLDEMAADAERQLQAMFPAKNMEAPAAIDVDAVRSPRSFEPSTDITGRALNEGEAPTPGAIEGAALRSADDFDTRNKLRELVEAAANANETRIQALADEIKSRVSADQKGRVDEIVRNIVRDTANENRVTYETDGPGGGGKGGGSPKPLSAGALNTFADSDRADDRLFGVYSPSGVQRAIGKAASFLRNPRLELQDALSQKLRSTLDRLDMVPHITQSDLANEVRNPVNVHGVHRHLSGKWAAAQEDASILYRRNRANYRNEDDFGTRVYRHIITGGGEFGDDAVVRTAAEGYRSYFDEVLKLFREAKLLRDDVDVRNADAYAPIVHVIDNIRANSGEFIALHQRDFGNTIMSDWARAVDTKRANDAKIATVKAAAKPVTDAKVAEITKEYGASPNSRVGKIADETRKLKDEAEAGKKRLRDDHQQKLAEAKGRLQEQQTDKTKYAVEVARLKDKLKDDIADVDLTYSKRIEARKTELAAERDAKIAAERKKFDDLVKKVEDELPEWDRTLVRRLGQDRGVAVERADLWARQLAESYYDGASKNAVIEGHDVAAQPGLANVLKARKSKTYQDELARRGWIETNIFRLGEAYHRRAGMDAAIATVFKRYDKARDEYVGDVNLTAVKADVAEEYKTLIDRARDAGDAEAESKLVAERNRQLENLETLLNLTRGRMSDPNAIGANMKTAGDMAMMFNAWRLMGGTVVSSLADPVNLVVANGFGKPLSHGVKAAFGNFRAALGAVPREELPDVFRINRIMGIVIEHQHNSRMGAMADLGAEAPSNRTQAWMQRFNRTFWQVTGITYWTNFWKNAAAATTHARIILAAQEGFDAQSPGVRAWLTNLKLGRSDLDAIKAAHEAQPNKYSAGVPYAALDQWQDAGLAQRVADAIYRESHNVIITPTAGDKLSLQATPVGQLVWQFRTYGVAASARLMSRNAALANVDGTHKANMYAGLFTLAMAGALVDGLKTTLGDTTIVGGSKDNNDSPLDKWLKRWEKTPGESLYNAVDRTGMFWLLMEPSNVAQKMGLPNIQGLASLAAGDEKDARSGASRFGQRTPFDAALGPSASLITDIAALGAFTTGGLAYGAGLNPEWSMSRSDFARVRRMVPLQNAPFVQQIINWGHQNVGTVFDWPDPE